jgi:hypothetical protein
VQWIDHVVVVGRTTDMENIIIRFQFYVNVSHDMLSCFISPGTAYPAMFVIFFLFLVSSLFA